MGYFFSTRILIQTVLCVCVGSLRIVPSYAHPHSRIAKRLAQSYVQSLPYANSHSSFTASPITAVKPIIRMQFKHLKSLSEFGFLHQGQTGFSRGEYNPLLRSTVEARYVGFGSNRPLPVSPIEFRPKYGMLHYETASETSREFLSSTGYFFGDLILWIGSSAFPRTTYTFNDSLNFHREIYPLSNLEPLIKFNNNQLDIKHHGDGYGDFIEAQFWGPLTLSDTHEISTTGLLEEGQEKVLDDVARLYGLSLSRIDPSQNHNHTLQMKKTMVKDYSYLRQQASFVLPRVTEPLAVLKGRVPEISSEVKRRVLEFALEEGVHPKVRAMAIHEVLFQNSEINPLRLDEIKRLVGVLENKLVFNELNSTYAHFHCGLFSK